MGGGRVCGAVWAGWGAGGPRAAGAPPRRPPHRFSPNRLDQHNASTQLDANPTPPPTQKQVILDLIKLRKSTGVNARSKVSVRKAAGDVYAATVDDKIAVKIGRGDWSPNSAGGKEWRVAVTGQNVAVWACE